MEDVSTLLSLILALRSGQREYVSSASVLFRRRSKGFLKLILYKYVVIYIARVLVFIVM